MMYTTDTATFVATRFTREDRAGIEGIAAGIVWGLHNADTFQEVLDGKSPKPWKALRSEIENKTTAAKTRQWSTNVRKAASLLFHYCPDFNVDKLPETLSESVDKVIEKLSTWGTNAYALNKAYAEHMVEEVEVEKEEETDPQPVVEASTVADVVAEAAEHGFGKDIKQSDIAQIMQFCIERASDATLDNLIRAAVEEQTRRINEQELENAEAA